MKFEPIPALVAFLVFSFLGIFSYMYLSHFDEIPQKLLDTFFLFAGIFTIPFLLWMCVGKTDKEWEIELSNIKKINDESDAIRKKYDSMPDLASQKKHKGYG